jgi:hypothetical protein
LELWVFFNPGYTVLRATDYVALEDFDVLAWLARVLLKYASERNR